MMSIGSGRYTVTETLRKNDKFVLQRGIRICGGRPVLLKHPSARHPFPETVRQLKHEWDIARPLGPGFVLRPLALDQHADRVILIPLESCLCFHDEGTKAAETWVEQ